MTKELTLNISDRYAALQLFNEFKGSTTELVALQDDIKQFVITDEEWKNAKLKKTPSDEEVALLPRESQVAVRQQWNWDNEGSEKTITVDSQTFEYLKRKIKEKSDAKEFTLADAAVVNLEKKLNQ